MMNLNSIILILNEKFLEMFALKLVEREHSYNVQQTQQFERVALSEHQIIRSTKDSSLNEVSQ